MDKKILAIILVAVLFFLSDSFYTLNEISYAMVFRFGEIVKVENNPGLHFKLPLIENVGYLDKRILNFNAEDKEVIARDQKRLIVSAFTKYRIVNPIKFYQTVQNETGAKSRLNALLDSSLRQIIGEKSLSDLLTDQRNEVMRSVKELFASQVNTFGIQVVDVRIMRADLPQENSQAIFKRMQADREKEAKEFRAEGAEQAAIIKSEADKTRKVLIAEAMKNAEIIRGEGDGGASSIYAKAYSQDPEFFSFLKSMDSYRSAMKGDNTQYILSPNSDFLKYFNQNGK